MRSNLPLLLAALVALPGCASPAGHAGVATYDLSAGLPKVSVADVVDLDKVGTISKFRSGVGHSFSDDDVTEPCRSMKHYFGATWIQTHAKEPEDAPVNRAAAFEVFAPFDGTIESLEPTHQGQSFRIRSDAEPALDAWLAHVDALDTIRNGTRVKAGQDLGFHEGAKGAFDVAVEVQTKDFEGPNKGMRFVSWFDTVTPEVFAKYQARGVSSPQEMVLSKAYRDAHPVPCDRSRHDGEFTPSSQDPFEGVQLS